jgi:hypothetical protein
MDRGGTAEGRDRRKKWETQEIQSTLDSILSRFII